MVLPRTLTLALVALACAFPAAAEGAPPLSVSDVTVSEGGGTASFSISNGGLLDLEVAYTTEDDTATAPGDYTSTTGTINIPVGESRTVMVPITQDTFDELGETFKLTASALLINAAGTATITDDDNDAPTARVDVNPQQAFVGKVIEFNGSRSSDPESQPLRYSWDLDANGSFETPTGVESAIGFAFFTTGLQAVGLRVTDPGSKSDSETGYALIFPPPPGFGRDTTPPSTNLFPVRRSLRLALRRGLRVRYGCSEACVIAGSVGVDRRTGRRIGLKGRDRTMGRAFSATTKAGSKVLTFKLSRRARRALAKVKKVRVNLRFKVRDAAFNVRVTNHRITLKR